MCDVPIKMLNQLVTHGIIVVHTPPLKFKSPRDTKASGPPLIYLVEPLAISDPHINIFVGSLTLAFIVGMGGGPYPPFLGQSPPLFQNSPLSRNPRCPHLL